MISNQSVFVFVRTTNLQFCKMQNKIYESLTTLQYHVTHWLRYSTTSHIGYVTVPRHM